MTNAGRPTDFDEAYIEQVEKLCQLGATDTEIADFFDVSVRTIYRWKLVSDRFCQAINSGKEKADERVQRSLYQKATGYEYKEEQAIKVKVDRDHENVEVVEVTKHQPADTTAAIFWLKNRKAAEWRDKIEQVHSGTLEVTTKEQRDAAVAAATRADS